MVAIRPQDSFSHIMLAYHLKEKGDLDEAIAEYREAIRLEDRGFAGAHSDLGEALTEKGQLEEAIVEFKEALRLRKDFDWAQKRLQEVERLVRLDRLLSAVLQGKDQPKDASERLALAHLCQRPFRKLYAAAANFYSAAFAEKPQLAEDLVLHYRYDAACAAALAGCDQGKDADKLDGKERLRLRQQALDWLRADLKAYRQDMEKGANKAESTIAERMQHWFKDDDFAGVREAEALARLPEAERKEWHKLWEEVEALRKRAAGQPKTASSARR
jgi:serine/threonine-protein kinase